MKELCVSRISSLVLLCLATAVYSQSSEAPYHPSWWSRSTTATPYGPGVTPPPTAPPNAAQLVNNTPLLEGQLKSLCKAALAEILDYQNGRGIFSTDPFLQTLQTEVANRSLTAVRPASDTLKYKSVINQGQLKNAAQPFLDYLAKIGYAQSGVYPWSVSQANNTSPANEGMAKYLFSFDLRKDSDSDGLPDWWEALYFSGPTAAVPSDDDDSDGQSNSQEYTAHTDPTSPGSLLAPTIAMENARFLNQATFGAVDVSGTTPINRSAWVDEQRNFDPISMADILPNDARYVPPSIFAPAEFRFLYRVGAPSDPNDPNPILSLPAAPTLPGSYATEIILVGDPPYEPIPHWHLRLNGPDGYLKYYIALGEQTAYPGGLYLQFYPQTFSSILQKNAITGKDQLRQRMALALSQLFVVSFKDDTLAYNGGSFGMADYYEKLGKLGFGNFSNIIKMIAKHPVMGVYLNSDGSTGAQPNQNFPRELLQLFTIGQSQINMDGSLVLQNGEQVPTYDQQDVVAVSKILSGYVRPGYAYQDNAYPISRKGWTDPMARTNSPSTETVVLSKLAISVNGSTTINCGAPGIDEVFLAALAKHPNVAPNIATHLIKSFVKANPSPRYINTVATVFKTNETSPYQMGLTMKAVLTDSEATTWPQLLDRKHAGRVRDPFIRQMHAARALGLGAFGDPGIFAHQFWTGIPFPSDQTLGAIPTSGGPPFSYDQTLLPPAMKSYGVNSGAASLGLVGGQFPLWSPSVFNFYRPDFVPTEWSSSIGTQRTLAPGLASSAHSPVMQINTADKLLASYDEVVYGCFSGFHAGTPSGAPFWNYQAGFLGQRLNSPLERWRKMLPAGSPTPTFEDIFNRLNSVMTAGRFKLPTTAISLLNDKCPDATLFSRTYVGERRYADAVAAFLIMSSPEFATIE